MFALRRTRPLTIPATTSPEARPISGRWIDPRAQRFGAGASALTLLTAAALNLWWLVIATAITLAASSAAGTRWFVFSRPWPAIRTVLGLPARELEHEIPPRFAQALGVAFLALGGGLAFAGWWPWAWLPVAMVVALQSLLAVTGFCVGCRLFFLRWWIPGLFARVAGRGVRREALIYVEPAER